jgi:hypothetical protein
MNKLYSILAWWLFAIFLLAPAVEANTNNNINNNNNKNNQYTSTNSTSVTTHKNITNTNQDATIIQLLETEVWEAATNSWKVIAGEKRWTNERGQASLSPSEVAPPEGFSYDGDWKIVVSGGDALGWDYQFQYLRPPKRRRIWLRSLKVISKPQNQTRLQQKQKKKALVTKPPQQVRPSPLWPSTSLSRTLERIRDDYNFKGFGLSVYKSFIFPSSFGVALRLPLTMNFDWWDSHPELPSVSSSFGLYFPGMVGVFLSAGVHVEWVKWIVKTILWMVPRLLIWGIYQLVLPALWLVASTLLMPLFLTNNNNNSKKKFLLPPIPLPPQIQIAKPRYNPELSEKVGCSLSYRWSISRGLEWRLGYWHSYLPTLTMYRKLLRQHTPLDWWQTHFGSIGLSTGAPIPDPPHVSCSACLSLSGLYFGGGGTSTSSSGSSSTITSSNSNSGDAAVTAAAIMPAAEASAATIEPPEAEPRLATRRVTTGKAESSWS